MMSRIKLPENFILILELPFNRYLGRYLNFLHQLGSAAFYILYLDEARE